MPPALHPHLKRGLDFDHLHIDPEDTIEALPTESLNSEQRAAKRRRVEAIAAQYLRGRPPIILTAALRGPFNNGWKNPWADNTRKKRRTSDKSSETAESRSQHGRKATASRRDTAEGTSVAKGRKGKGRVVAKEISPEAPRATKGTLDGPEDDNSLHNVEVPPATAPLPEEEMSSATEFFSVNTARTVQNQPSLTNPFWLRRPESTRINMRKAANENTDVSPTRSRSRDGPSQTHKVAELRLSVPQVPIRVQRSPEKVAIPEDWRSSASASMIISSPAKTTDIATDHQVNASTPASALKEHSMSKLHEVNTPATATTHVRPRNTESGQCAQQSPLPVTSSVTGQSRPSKNHLQRSTEPTHSASKKQSQRSGDKGTQNEPMSTAKRHEPLTSPVPASSTGFVYRRIAESRREGDNTHKPKPRAVDFNSSPALKQKVQVVPEQPQNMATIQESGDGAPQQYIVETEATVQDRPEADGATTIMQDENQELRTSRGSDWSTQAAMLLAQLEFQESTFPTISPAVSRVWSQPSQNTPRPKSAVPSPAMTPFSVLETDQDELLPGENVLQGPPISTQDLFGAASPFSFSTVKKKPEMPSRSHLRFAMSPTDNTLPRLNDLNAKSPTPSAERIPLKDKNTTASFWSFVTEKASQESLVNRSRRTLNDVALPQLNFHTSLDDFGSDGGLHFTDRFLCNIDDT